MRAYDNTPDNYCNFNFREFDSNRKLKELSDAFLTKQHGCADLKNKWFLVMVRVARLVAERDTTHTHAARYLWLHVFWGVTLCVEGEAR